ncbi:MAG: CooT family nickel-binding protein [Desulfobacterales bacterium]|jgi:predicted RNA-binding protein
MCDIDVFVVRDGGEEKVMENVDRVEATKDGLRIQNIFGEQQTLQGRLFLYDNGLKKMVFEAT